MIDTTCKTHAEIATLLIKLTNDLEESTKDHELLLAENARLRQALKDHKLSAKQTEVCFAAYIARDNYYHIWRTKGAPAMIFDAIRGNIWSVNSEKYIFSLRAPHDMLDPSQMEVLMPFYEGWRQSPRW